MKRRAFAISWLLMLVVVISAAQANAAGAGVPGSGNDNAIRVAEDIKAFTGDYPPGKAPLAYYTVPAVSPVKRLSDTFPEDGQLCGRLQVVAAQGEFEPASFVVFSFADFEGVQLKASALHGTAGTIPAANVDLKIVKCWYQAGTAWYSYFADTTGRELIPELLLNDENLIKVDTASKDNYLRADYPKGTRYIWISNPQSVDVPFNAETTPVADAATIQPFCLEAGRFKQVWVTVSVPDRAAPGIYEGSLELLYGAGKAISIPVSLRVLPFKLPRPMTNYDINRTFFTILYTHPNYSDILRNAGGDRAHADRKMLAIYENMRAHNILHPLFPAYGRYPGELFVRQLQIMKRAGLCTDPIFGAVTGIPPYRWISSPAVVNVPLERQPEPTYFINNVNEALGVVKRTLGHTNVYCDGWDEPSMSILTAERKPWKYIHDKGLKIYSTASPRHLKYGGYNEDLVNYAGTAERSKADPWHAMGSRIVNYAGPHTGPENPDFVRRTHGLQLYKANYDGIGNYILDLTGWNDFLGEVHNFRNFTMAYPTRNGVVNTIEWEGMREAVDDVRYATKLKQLAHRAMATGKTEAVYAGRRALLWLELLDEKNVDLNAARLEMINYILELSEIR